MVDFLIVMLERKVPRKILEDFIRDFNEFLDIHHAIKVFILMNKFILMNQVMRNNH